MTPFRRMALLLGIPFLACLAFLTLTPSRVENAMPNLLDLALRAAHRLGWESLDFTRLEVLANVLVFIPIGILAVVLLPRRFRALAWLIGPAVSAGIELAQRIALPHRAATISDVLANSSGATIGVIAALLLSLLFTRSGSQARSSKLETS
ncbi:VanZ family protein [Microbacterium sp. SD291]|uniref:VanZ family protein n=1 Tax=Microbacterium sp. SD291 TaxID=2782007 RepID=UPI001A97B971|nr:VanZ family protein [Microbacterium sp. SD291]MBO0979931.1 VanZ family protein [Microbacterium sp. SD291]